MNKLRKFSSILFFIFLISCGLENEKKTKVELVGFSDNTTIIFDQDSLRFYFGKNDLIKFCEDSKIQSSYVNTIFKIKTAKGDTTIIYRDPGHGAKEPVPFIFRGDSIDLADLVFKNALFKSADSSIQISISSDTLIHTTISKLLPFLKSLKDTTIIIKDSSALKSDTVLNVSDITYEANGDTIIPGPDWDDNQTQYSVTLERSIPDILRMGKGKVYDVLEKKFADHIIIKDFYEPFCSGMEMYLPNGKMFYRREICQ